MLLLTYILTVMSDCSLNIDCITCLADLSSCNACAVNGKYVSCTTGSCETNSTSLNIGTCSALCEMQFDCRACVNAGCQWGTIADLDCDSEEAMGPCSQLPVHTNVAKSILAPPVAIDSAKRSANGTNCTEATCSDCTADTSQCFWCYTSMQGHCISSKNDCNDSLIKERVVVALVFFLAVIACIRHTATGIRQLILVWIQMTRKIRVHRLRCHLSRVRHRRHKAVLRRAKTRRRVSWCACCRLVVMMCIGKRGSIIGGAIGGGIVCAGIAALIAFVVCRKRASDGTAGSAAGAASIDTQGAFASARPESAMSEYGVVTEALLPSSAVLPASVPGAQCERSILRVLCVLTIVTDGAAPQRYGVVNALDPAGTSPESTYAVPHTTPLPAAAASYGAASDSSHYDVANAPLDARYGNASLEASHYDDARAPLDAAAQPQHEVVNAPLQQQQQQQAYGAVTQTVASNYDDALLDGN
jgi:hypothetical protein